MKKAIYDKLIKPVIDSKDDPQKIALGAGVGMWVALTPTVGVQMTMVVILALIPRLNFNIPVAIAMVWISNPLTMVPLYFSMYKLGILLQGVPGVSFSEFEAIFLAFVDSLKTNDSFVKSFWEGIVGLFRVGVDIAVPMWLGALVIATVISIPTYLLTLKAMNHRKARNRTES